MSKSDFVNLTDEVVKEILKHEVILPSLYQEIFEKVAKEKGIDLDDPKVIKEYASIELVLAKKMMKKNHEDMKNIVKCSSEAKEAIEAKDSAKLDGIELQLQEITQETKKVQESVYKDPLTRLNNRMWINEKYLEDSKFISKGCLVYLFFDGIGKIKTEHGKEVCDKVTMYIATFLNKLYPDVELVKYSETNFVYFLEEDKEELEERFSEASASLESKNLKAKNGKPLHLSFLHSIVEFEKDDIFRDVIEMSSSLLASKT